MRKEKLRIIIIINQQLDLRNALPMLQLVRLTQSYRFLWTVENDSRDWCNDQCSNSPIDEHARCCEDKENDNI